MKSMDVFLTVLSVAPTSPHGTRARRPLPIALTVALLGVLALSGPGAASVIVNVNPHKLDCAAGTVELSSLADQPTNFDANAYHLPANCTTVNKVLTLDFGKPLIVSDDSALGGDETAVMGFIDDVLAKVVTANDHGRYHYEHFDHASDPKAKLGQTFASLSDFNAQSKSVLDHIEDRKCGPTQTIQCVSTLVPYGTLTRSGDRFLWNGQGVTLVGFSSMGALAGTSFDVEGYLDVLASKGVNLTRVWAIEQWTALEVDAASQDVNNCETPFAGTYNSKWDLDQVNQRYMERAHRFVQAAAERGIVVQLTLFDRHGLRNFTGELGTWAGSPYNTNNNTQTFLSAGSSENAPTGFLSTSQTSGVGKVNHDLTTRLVSELGGYGNVLFEVMNEPREVTGEWTASSLLTWHQWVESAAKATTPDQVIGEVGSVDVNHVQKTVSFRRTYTNPVVIAQPPTIAGGQAAIARIDSVSPSNFKLRIQEPSNLDGSHVVETVNYVVIEAGSWRLPDGTRLEVGKLNTGATVGQGVANTWAQVTFANTLGSSPVVLSQVQSSSDSSFVKTRQVNASATGFQVAMEQEDSDTVAHGAETLGWVAMDPGQGTWSGHPYRAANTGNSVTHNTNPWFAIAFNLTEICNQTPSPRGLGPLPRFLASIATYDGSDGSTLRQQNLSATGVEIKVEEDTTVTPGINHTTEVVSYLALGEDGLLTGAALSAPPDLPPVANFTFNCTDLSCSFNASGSTDDHGIVSYSWNFGDSGSGSGVTPSHTYATGGTYNVTLTVTDTVGQTDTDTQPVTVSAPTTCGSTNPPPPPPAGALDFDGFSITPYGSGQNPQGELTLCIEDNGFTLHLAGNGWQKISFPYTITANTILEFDFRSPDQGEVHGLGFDDNNDITDGRMFQVYGTQAHGVTTFNDYAGSAPNWKHYKIRVGDHFTGNTLYLTFANDHDAPATPTAESFFANVRVYEATVINFLTLSPGPYGSGQNPAGELTVAIEDAGFTLHLTGNGWRKVDLPVTITQETILEFDFRSPAQGEVHGVGFDDDHNLQSARMFEVYGTDPYGVTLFNDYAGSAPNWKHYKIRVGDYLPTSSNLFVTFANDHDAPVTPTAEGYFRNVTIY